MTARECYRRETSAGTGNPRKRALCSWATLILATSVEAACGAENPEAGVRERGDTAGAPELAAAAKDRSLKIRLGRPYIVRGPTEEVGDIQLSEIRLSNGNFRAFTANGSTYAIDGSTPWAMGGSAALVLSPGPASSYNECGQWLSHVERVDEFFLGFIHAETRCDYGATQTHKSMALGTSTDEGLTWTVHGQFLAGVEQPTNGRITGEGDCTVVSGNDGYLYSYCLRARDWQTIVARAPIANPYPGQWRKFYWGAWSEPGLGGDATPLGAVGQTAARWTSSDEIILLSLPPEGGLRASFSPDKVTFESLDEPLLVANGFGWARPTPAELIAYPSLINRDDGSKILSSESSPLLSYTYIPPNEDFHERYIVFRDVYISRDSTALGPQVGIPLSRWYDPSRQDRWSTTAPVPGNYVSHGYEQLTGYLMTQAHATLPTTALEECVSYWPGHPDHLLTNATCAAEGYQKLRTAGWIFDGPQANTIPLYRCFNPAESHHFASTQADCEGMGYAEWLMGYALRE